MGATLGEGNRGGRVVASPHVLVSRRSRCVIEAEQGWRPSSGSEGRWRAVLRSTAQGAGPRVKGRGRRESVGASLLVEGLSGEELLERRLLLLEHEALVHTTGLLESARLKNSAWLFRVNFG